MSKGNLFLGQARGSVGDVTFTHIAGVQVTRARNRSPKNPQSILQLVQRICLNTSSKAFSALQDICNHSYEGFAEGTPCQAMFMKRNTQLLRDKLAAVIATPTEDVLFSTNASNFSYKGDLMAAYNEYEVSHGTLPSLAFTKGDEETGAAPRVAFSVPSGTTAASLTYADVISGLGLQRGDQLTFLAVGHDYDDPNSESYISAVGIARVILEPASGDLTTAFLSTSVINSPNPRNEGEVYFSATIDGTTCTLKVPQLGNINSARIGTALAMVGFACIVSRQQGDTWLRSSERIMSLWLPSQSASVLNNMLIGDAYLTYKAGPSASSLYLNQSENF